jgi:hypothetical protein
MHNQRSLERETRVIRADRDPHHPTLMGLTTDDDRVHRRSQTESRSG